MAELMVGQTAELTGFVGLTKTYLGHTPAELGLILGYGTGTLMDGYWFGRLVEPISLGGFALRGYTMFPGGKPLGSQPTVHASMKKSLSNHPNDRANWQKQLVSAVERLNRKGVDRVCKVIPKREPDSYPAGWGVPQYELLKGFARKFLIEAEVLPPQRIYRRADDSIYVA